MGAYDITFPVEFLYPPIVLTTCVNASMTHVHVCIKELTTEGFTGWTRAGNNVGVVSTTFFWFAIGPVA